MEVVLVDELLEAAEKNLHYGERVRLRGLLQKVATYNADDIGEKVCPFCGEKYIHKPWLNIICTCGAKYYFVDRFWLDRGTGERRADNALG